METKKLEVRCECPISLTAKTFAFFNKQFARDRAIAANKSPFSSAKCEGCDGKGFILVANGPDDADRETCGGCNGTGRVLASN